MHMVKMHLISLAVLDHFEEFSRSLYIIETGDFNLKIGTLNVITVKNEYRI